MGEAKSYAERLFEFVEVGPQRCKSRAKEKGIEIASSALDLIVNKTCGYPYFLQEWGKHASGPSRHLTLGAQMLEFRHAPTWQLIFPGRAAGEVVRAMAWLGPENAGDAIRTLRARLPESTLNEVASAL